MSRYQNMSDNKWKVITNKAPKTSTRFPKQTKGWELISWYKFFILNLLLWMKNGKI